MHVSQLKHLLDHVVDDVTEFTFFVPDNLSSPSYISTQM
jgi:hypothetical protein